MLNSLIGIIASSGGVTSTNSYESIATTTVGAGGASSITFSSIPSTYQHLQIRMLARSTTAAGNSNAYIQFNSDTAANYSFHELTGSGGTAGSAGSASITGPRICNYPAASSTASMFGGGVIDILDYKDTNKYKTYRSLNGNDQNGSGYIILFSGNWRSTSAVSSIVIGDNSGGNFVQYSSFALYGIKG
jgi:hypothetical protein